MATNGITRQKDTRTRQKAKNEHKRATLLYPGIRIRERRNRTGSGISWRVEVGAKVTGEKRVIRQFPQREEAETYALGMHNQRVRFGMSAFSLSDGQRSDALQAIEKLTPLGVSLTEAADFFVRHARPPAGDISIAELVDKLIEFKRDRQKMRPRYLADLRSRLGSLARSFGTRSIRSITSAEIEEWLYADLKISEQTRDNHFRALSVLFNFARGRRDKRGMTAPAYRIDNPMDAVPRPSVDHEPPKILTPKKAKILLLAAISKKGAPMGLMPWVVLGLFCGLRSTELMQLKWKDIRISAGWVTVDARIAKKRRMRNVPIPENAAQWLKIALGEPEDPIAPPNAEKRIALLGKLAKIHPWPTNCLRHSFGSYDFALSDNAATTAAKLGHKDDDVLFQHYRALTDKTEAEQFFKIVPPARFTE